MKAISSNDLFESASRFAAMGLGMRLTSRSPPPTQCLEFIHHEIVQDV